MAKEQMPVLGWDIDRMLCQDKSYLRKLAAYQILDARRQQQASQDFTRREAAIDQGPTKENGEEMGATEAVAMMREIDDKFTSLNLENNEVTEK